MYDNVLSVYEKRKRVPGKIPYRVMIYL